MSNMIQIGDQMFFHPGYYLQEWLEEKNMSVEEFADKNQYFKRECQGYYCRGQAYDGFGEARNIRRYRY